MKDTEEITKRNEASSNRKTKRQKVSEKFKHYPKKIRLKHITFVLVALAGIALTTSTIVILWRLTSVRVVSDKVCNYDYIGAIGVLVAFVAAFLGLLVTIMFGNYIYNNIEVKRKLQEIDKQRKTIADLYVVALRAEANISKSEEDYLRATERWLGVIYYFLKTSYSLNTEVLERFIKSLDKCVRRMNYDNIKKFYISRDFPDLDNPIKINGKELTEINSTIRLGLKITSHSFEMIYKQSNLYRVSYLLDDVKDLFTKKKEEILLEMGKTNPDI